MSQQYVQKYVIVHFVDIGKTPVNFSASEWPLHITLLANFQVEDIVSFSRRLEEYSQRHAAFTVRSSGEALFGPQQNVRVSLIEQNKSILTTHNDLLSIATEQGSILDEPKFAGTGYRPHATIQIDNRLHDHEEIKINTFSLVDMFPSHDHTQRKIIQTYTLRG